MVSTERLADVTIVNCPGRIVEGDASTALDRAVDEALPYTPFVVLDMNAVEFIDSSGLGLLVRLLHRTRRAGGNLTLCAVPNRVDAALNATRLSTMFGAAPGRSDAVTLCLAHTAARTPDFGAPDLLCVHPSADVIAYLRELLSRGGYALITATNVADALTLLRATRPRGLVVANEVRAATTTAASQTFNRLADQLPVVVLPGDFSTDEAGHAAQTLMTQVREMLPKPASAPQL